MAEVTFQLTRQSHRSSLLYHLFSVDNNTFLFDARTYACFQVSQCLVDAIKLYDSLSDADIIELLGCDYPRLEVATALVEIKRAIDNKYLSIQDFHHCEAGVFRKLTLVLTGSCNLRCSYCFEGGRVGRDIRRMQSDTIDAAVDYLIRFSCDNRVELAFYGGEPLLNFSGLKRATERVRQPGRDAGKEISLVCITNGTLIDVSKARYFAENDICVQVSCDGPADMHDAARVYVGGRGSSDAVEAAIERLQAAGARYALMATIGRHNCDLHRVCSYLKKAQTFDFSVSSDLARYTGGQQWSDLQEGVKALEPLWHVDDYSVPMHVRKLKSRIRNCAILWFGCGAGMSEFTVDVDGKVWACERFAGTAGPNIAEVLKEEREPAELYDGFLVDVDSREECRKCWAKYLCGGGCKHNALEASPSASPSTVHCDVFRAEAEMVLRQLTSPISNA